MDDLRFYRDCEKALKLLMDAEDGSLDISELNKISPDYYKMIIFDFTKKEIAKYDRILERLEINREVARNFYFERTYERLGDVIEENRRRDKLSEISTNSAVKSADAAQKSANAAQESVILTRKSKVFTIVSIGISLLSLLIAALTYFYKE